MSDPLKPPITILIKLGSITVHVDEMLSAHGHDFDRIAIESLLSDPELVEWLKQMTSLALLPLNRNL